MLPAERRQRILERIQQRGSAEVSELAIALGVSSMTIRRDLAHLAAEGLIDRTFGGAVVLPSTTYEPLYAEKSRANADAKNRIGAAAAALVQDGDTVILDSGTTTMAVARQLTDKRNLTVVTNDLLIATELLPVPTLRLVVTGGITRPDHYSMVGVHTEAFLRQTNANKLFLGADAVDLQRGITNATWEEVQVKRLMIEAAQEVVLVADHTKFDLAALAKVADLEQVDVVITDAGLPEELAEQLHAKGLVVQRV